MPYSIALASPCCLVSGKNSIAVVKIICAIEGDPIGAGAGVDRLEPRGHGSLGFGEGIVPSLALRKMRDRPHSLKMKEVKAPLITPLIIPYDRHLI